MTDPFSNAKTANLAAKAQIKIALEVKAKRDEAKNKFDSFEKDIDLVRQNNIKDVKGLKKAPINI